MLDHVMVLPPKMKWASSSGATAAGHLLVRKLEMHGALADDDKAALRCIDAEVRRIEAGGDLVLDETPAQGLFVILEGFACRYKLCPSGARRITAYLLPGDFCNLDVLLFPRLDYSIGALSGCTVARLSPATVHDLLQRPALARALRLVTFSETATLREWLVNMGTRRAKVRVAHLFCELLARLQAMGLTKDTSFDFPLTQTDLAETTGMSIVHMNRSLRDLRCEGLVELRSRRLTISDLPRLKALAEFKASYLHLGATAAA